MGPDIAIITSAHWSGDPRLNRHAKYLQRAGQSVEIRASNGRARIVASVWALTQIVRTRATTVILPDPELFVLGSIIARATGKRSIIDIHEDYPSVVASRSWAPGPLRPLIRAIVRTLIALGRRLSSRVVVAAPELARVGDSLVMNLPEPAELPESTESRRFVVYVGDVTVARGALEMVETLAFIEPSISLVVIGRVDEQTRASMLDTARRHGVEQRLIILGLLAHQDAWAMAGGAIAGLCLLRPLPAYQKAIATKIWEYLAAGIPPVVTDLPGQRALVSQIDAALVAQDAQSAGAIIDRLDRDPVWRDDLLLAGRNVLNARWEEMRPDLAVQEAVVLP